MADFGDFGGAEEVVVGVAAYEGGLLPDCEAVVADLVGGGFVSFVGWGSGMGLRTGIRFLISPGQVYGTGLWFPCSSRSAKAGLKISSFVTSVICVSPLRASSLASFKLCGVSSIGLGTSVLGSRSRYWSGCFIISESSAQMFLYARKALKRSWV